MARGRLTNYLHKSLAWIESHRLFRPWRHHFAKRTLWRFNRHTVARGVAIGFFFGVMTPVAQIVFATVAAIMLRANLVVAAGSTLISNPLTTPLILYGAFRIGVFVMGPSQEIVEDVIESEEAASRALDVDDWYTTLMDWMSSVGPPLTLGLFLLALTLALAGYLLTHLGWGSISRLRKRIRRSSRESSSGSPPGSPRGSLGRSPRGTSQRINIRRREPRRR